MPTTMQINIMKTQLNQARNYLTDGEAQRCITALVEALNNSTLPQAATIWYSDQLALISAGQNAYQRKLNTGTVAGTEANVEAARINTALLQLITDLEAGKTPEQTVTASKQNNTRWIFIALGLVALFLGGLWFFRSRQLECPVFQADKKWKISVLPFTNLGDRDAKPEQVIAATINEITTKNQLSAQAIVWDTDSKKVETDKQKALQTCSNDLLITGQYVVLSSDSIEVSLNYQFSDQRPPLQTEFTGFRNVSALREGVMQNRSVKDAIFSLCTVLAMRENNMPLAQKWLDKIQKPEGWEAEMKAEQ
jgi:hypothetical protein